MALYVPGAIVIGGEEVRPNVCGDEPLIAKKPKGSDEVRDQRRPLTSMGNLSEKEVNSNDTSPARHSKRNIKLNV